MTVACEQEIPDLSSLTQITELRLSHNKIKKVPAHLAKLGTISSREGRQSLSLMILQALTVYCAFPEQLRVLELGHNEIDDWEGIEAISALPSLKQLVLRGNPVAGKSIEVSLAEEKAAKEEAAKEGSEVEEETEEEQKRKGKLYKKLDATNKHYNFKIKRLFPMLVVRDGQRVMDKKTHGYVAPPKEEKEKKEKPEKKAKKDKSKPKKSDDNDTSDEKKVVTEKHEKRVKRERKPDGDAHDGDADAVAAKPAKKSKLNSGEPHVADVKIEKKAAADDSTKPDKSAAAGSDKPQATKGAEQPKVKKEKMDKKDKKKAPKVSTASLAFIIHVIGVLTPLVVLSRTSQVEWWP